MKLCIKCGHPPCPHCLTWCDEVLEVVDEDGERDVELCCDGECEYPPEKEVE